LKEKADKTIVESADYLCGLHPPAETRLKDHSKKFNIGVPVSALKIRKTLQSGILHAVVTPSGRAKKNVEKV